MIEKVPAINIAMLIISGLFCLLMPVAILIILKIKNKSSKLIAALAGAVTFFVWALCLEQLLHTVMLPLVQGNVVLYTIYGALAAGVFEETGRFVTYKFFLKKTTAEGNPANSIMYGIGHGGIEPVIIMSLNMLTYAAIAILINMGQGQPIIDSIIGSVPPEQTELAMTQLESFMLGSPLFYIAACFERVLAVTVHVIFSVMVFAAARSKKNLWLFPMSIGLHALFDVPAALFQCGVLPIWVGYIFMIIMLAIMTPFVMKLYKSMKKEYVEK